MTAQARKGGTWRHGRQCTPAAFHSSSIVVWQGPNSSGLPLTLPRVSAEAMFKPLQDTVALLDRFGNPLEPELLRRLEDGPRQWRLLSKKMFT